ncbi:MAG: C13 family peptidase [Burkholderiales bacterium]
MPAIHALKCNLRAGLQCAFFMRANVVATWGQAGLLLALNAVSIVFWEWVVAGFAPRFDPTALPGASFGLLLLWAAACAIAALNRTPARALDLAVALLSAGVWLDVVLSLAHVAAYRAGDGYWALWAQWIVYVVAIAWPVAIAACLRTEAFSLAWPRRGAAALAAIVLVGVPLLYSGGSRPLWVEDHPEREASGERLDFEAAGREEVLYAQAGLLDRDLAALLPREPGRPNLYLIAVAGYGYQAVFRREVDAVDKLFAERFGTAGRSIRLVNSPSTVLTTPVATRTALARSIRQVGALMDPEQDILFLFLTSHGSKQGRFSLDLYPFRFAPVTPPELRQMLDEAGIRNRVIVVSACYSGTFLEPLRTEDSLVITASAADRNSFGCSNEADLTYFGKAYFDDALRRTDSFVEAFDLALPAIAAREKQSDYKPSEPQRAVGSRIEDTLARWQAGRGATPR